MAVKVGIGVMPAVLTNDDDRIGTFFRKMAARMAERADLPLPGGPAMAIT